jgi:hypothetical protein
LLDRHHSLIVYLHQLLNRRVDILGSLPKLEIAERVVDCDSKGHSAKNEELKVEPSETIFVGDNPIADVAGAKAAGMRAIWVEDAHWEEPAIADGKITRLSELPDLIDQLSRF